MLRFGDHFETNKARYIDKEISARITNEIHGKEAIPDCKVAPNMASSHACGMVACLKQHSYLHVYSM
jgi:hypothetical protein